MEWGKAEVDYVERDLYALLRLSEFQVCSVNFTLFILHSRGEPGKIRQRLCFRQFDNRAASCFLRHVDTRMFHG